MLQDIAPYFGYLASLMLIFALLVKSELKFRWFNICGNIFFITYALVIGAIPVLLTNCILICINIYYLVKHYSHKESFDLMPFTAEEKLVKKFIDFHAEDINKYFPAFSEKDIVHGNLNFVVARDLNIANIFSAYIDAGGDAVVSLNYTTPRYRDFKIGTFIFEKEKAFLLSKGIKRIVYKVSPYKKHLKFLNVMGFTKQHNNGTDEMVKVL